MQRPDNEVTVSSQTVSSSFLGDTGSCAHQVTESNNTQATICNTRQKQPGHPSLVINANIRAEILSRATRERDAKRAADSNSIQEAPGGTLEESTSQLQAAQHTHSLVSPMSQTSQKGGNYQRSYNYESEAFQIQANHKAEQPGRFKTSEKPKARNNVNDSLSFQLSDKVNEASKKRKPTLIID